MISSACSAVTARFVGSVTRGERIEHVRERDHACLNRDLGIREPFRIAGAIQLLVMAGRVLHEVLQVVRPRNLIEKGVRFLDVRFDLGAFSFVQRPARELEIVQLIRREVRRGRARPQRL